MLCGAVHAAFYLWYGNPETDGQWRHWDHAVLPHWSPSIQAQFPSGQAFSPPAAPHSPFVPSLGLYSSADVEALRSQLESVRKAGIDSVMLSWWGQADASVGRDSQGVSTDELVPLVLDAAHEAGVGVTWHLEPYGGRTPESVGEDLAYLHERYVRERRGWIGR
jgi:glycoprotein endo-alpha-1,2-mannosidase